MLTVGIAGATKFNVMGRATLKKEVSLYGNYVEVCVVGCCIYRSKHWFLLLVEMGVRLLGKEVSV